MFVAGGVLVGVDLGYQHQTWHSDPEDHEAYGGRIVAGRIGVQYGGRGLWFRAGFELYRWDVVSDNRDLAMVEGSFTGFDVVAAAAYSF